MIYYGTNQQPHLNMASCGIAPTQQINIMTNVVKAAISRANSTYAAHIPYLEKPFKYGEFVLDGQTYSFIVDINNEVMNIKEQKPGGEFHQRVKVKVVNNGNFPDYVEITE